MINVVLVKKDMLRYMQDVRTVRGMGRGLSDKHVVLCKFRLVGVWTKRREVVDGTRRIRREKLKENMYIGYSRSLCSGRKCKRSVWLSESWGKEPKECMVER